MTPLETAFLEADLNAARMLPSIWQDAPADVPALQDSAFRRIMSAFRPLKHQVTGNVTGQVVTGPAGAGKTHLMGTLRREVWRDGGSFILIDLAGLTEFGRTAAHGFTRSLRKRMPDGRAQYKAVFDTILPTLPKEDLRRVLRQSEGADDVAKVSAFLRALDDNFDEAKQHRNVIRALLLQDYESANSIAFGWLEGLNSSAEERAALGLTAPPPPPEDIVRGVCWLLSLAGPVMVAIDQVDPIVTAANIGRDGTELEMPVVNRATQIIHELAAGLLSLYDITHRGMTVITCLTETWALLCDQAIRSATDRFIQTPIVLDGMAADDDAVTALVAGRLAPAFAREGATPPYPTWPFTAAALAELKGEWPRRILRACDEFRQRHYGFEAIPDCTSFVRDDAPLMAAPDLALVFAGYRANVALGGLQADDEGAALARCLCAVLGLYTRQLSLPDTVSVNLAPSAESRPAVNARLTFTFHDQHELEKHFCFKVLPHAHPRAVQARLRSAMTEAGIDTDLPFRHLFVIRTTPFPAGAVTKTLTDDFARDGGVVLAIGDEDLRGFAALMAMDDARIPGFEAWLRAARPLCETVFFKTVGLCPPPLSVTAAVVPLAAAAPAEPPLLFPAAPALKAAPAAEIPLGRRMQGAEPGPVVALPVALLTRHVAIFAGSGSGKTVLLRRIVEEAALRGVPAIVIDTNNDLVRLGQTWPARPAGFCDEDEAAAARFRRDVEVVVWTPGVAAGRPLTLAVLPNFAALEDAGARAEAVEMGWATLSPLIGASGATRDLKEGLLKEALTGFAVERQSGIDRFTAYLAELPAGVSQQSNAGKLALAMADQLRAKVKLNPLLNAPGQPLDPAALFTAGRAGATRISVINLAGLGDDARQDFVNQLQMALFTFIRRAPSATPRLYVLDEAQNFAPSAMMTASKASAKALAAQARKFGLGMIFATQAPKGIDTNIVSNCTTHVYGRMSSPALIQATEQMMEARGRAAKDLGALSAGQFYVSMETPAQPVKVKTPWCLSWHPQTPATQDEIVEIAKK